MQFIQMRAPQGVVLTQILMASKFVISNGIQQNVEKVLHEGSFLIVKVLVESYKWEVCEVFYMLLHWRFFISAPIMVQSWSSSGSLAVKLRELIISVESLIQIIGRFQPIVFMSLQARGFFQWIVLLVIIIRFASFSLDFGTQVVAGWIFFVQNLEAEISLVVPPVSLIARAVHYLPVSRAFATIVVPFLAIVIFLAHYFQKIFRFVVDYRAFFDAAALE